MDNHALPNTALDTSRVLRMVLPEQLWRRLREKALREMTLYLFGREMQEICKCNGRCWRLLNPEEDMNEILNAITTLPYIHCPICAPHKNSHYNAPKTRYYTP